ncbi:MAG: class III extradiol dioxygenase subunit B-like domain-containing protein [Sporichthyaceae bacterium]
MLLAAALCPHPALLVPQVAGGAAPELDELRAACDTALAAALASPPQRVVVVGAGAHTSAWPLDAAGALAGFGIAGLGPGGDLPLSLTIGRWLLERASWSGPLELHSIAAGASSAQCAALGARLATGVPTFLLAVGDGSARRSLAAPGHLDDRAEGFDADVAKALTSVDVEALLDLDEDLAADLLAAGRPAWQVLAGAARVSGRWRAVLDYDDAPYGVGYFVASWVRADVP